MNSGDSRRSECKGTAPLDRLAQAANEAHVRLQAAASVLEEIQEKLPGIGDLWVLPSDPGLAGGNAGHLGDAVEWAVLEADDRGCLYLVPVDGSPFLGTADVAASDGRVLRCALGVWFELRVLAGARRTGVLDVSTLKAVQERRCVVDSGQVHGTLEALETNRDPEYRHLILAMEKARGILESQFGPQEGIEGAISTTVSATPSAIAPARSHQTPRHQRPRHQAPGQPLRRQRRQRSWASSVALAASFLLTAALVVIVVQWRMINELRDGDVVPIVDSPVVWLEPVGERGQTKVEAFPLGTRFVVLLMRPEMAGGAADAYRLEIFTAGKDEGIVWSGELAPGTLPELFVLVPGNLFDPGEYRLQLTGQRAGEEIPAGRFRLEVSARAPNEG